MHRFNDQRVSNLGGCLSHVKQIRGAHAWVIDNPGVPSPTTPPTSDALPPQTHYENFPVASWLCPPRLRAPIAAIYWFARTADDLADEGDADAPTRLADLAAYRADLARAAHPQTPADQPLSTRWPQVFGPLHQAIHGFALPVALLQDLLSAFEQDVHKTRDGAGYASRAELLDYCRRSANPVGRLLLHLYGVNDATSLAQSDAICSALQLINFWQDLSVDIPRGRYYLPLADCAAHGVRIRQPARDFAALRSDPNTINLIATCANHARATMHSGAPLVHRLPGRAGWELRLVVQGGLRILDKVEALKGGSLHTRPRLHAWDWVVMLGRALVM